MDESLQELENELKRLRPRGSSEELQARLERELGAPATAPVRPRYTTATTLSSWKWFSWQMAAAAAVALTVSLAVWRFQRGAVNSQPVAPEAVVRSEPVAPPAPQPETRVAANPAPASDSYRPVGAANVLYDMKEDGTVVLPDNTPARRMRYRYVDTYTWKNPATNASLKWSVPRDEVRVIPASLH